MTEGRMRAAAWAVVVGAVVSGCSVLGVGPAGSVGEDVDAQLGRELIQRYGCGSCHTIPGVHGADGLVAPPLTRFSERSYIAGQLVNTPENLARWIADPQEVEEGTAMPNLGVTEEEAANIAAYLHTLR